MPDSPSQGKITGSSPVCAANLLQQKSRARLFGSFYFKGLDYEVILKWRLNHPLTRMVPTSLCGAS